MYSTPNGSVESLEKFPLLGDPPPSITPPSTEAVLDAGLKSLTHCMPTHKRRLPLWRYELRQKLLPLVRWETPYLAWMQDKMRSPALDSYFAITANLGTHTFFMTALPILFWCGHTSLGKSMVHILASGVFFTGFIKDMLSLPRPLSPPLQRITMSGSAALEYGFPSTHSANAVSVAVYVLFSLHSPDSMMAPTTKSVLEVAAYCYAFSIILGRLYCGMHGFFDVVIGSIVGALLSVVECVYWPVVDNYLHTSTWRAPFALAAFILALVRIHPEPADDCPCFDDSVAFAGVMIGVELGGWHYATTSWSWDYPVPATVPFDLELMGWKIVILRVVFGVLIVFAWRGVMKPTLLWFLPHLFRVIEKAGLILPRKYFMPASEYNKIPSHLRVDNVMPSVSDLPSLLTSIRHPARGRAVSIGPQSAADAYETLAYREKRRRESIGENGVAPQIPKKPDESNNCISTGKMGLIDPARANVTGASTLSSSGGGSLSSPVQSRIGPYEQMMGQGQILTAPNALNSNGITFEDSDGNKVETGSELGEKEMFLMIEKPRVRYDVEVVTKLIVYGGIAWLAVEGNPILFELVGLGMGSVPRPVR